MHALIHMPMHFWIQKKKSNYSHFPKLSCCLFHTALANHTERLTDTLHVLALAMQTSLHSFGPDPWRCAALKSTEAEEVGAFLGGHGRGRREAGVLHCLSPLGQYLPRACPVPAARCLIINRLKWNARKCDLSHGPAVHYTGIAGFCRYANASHVWLSFRKLPCPVQWRTRSNACRKPAPELRAPGPALGWAPRWVRPEGAAVSSLRGFVSVGIKTQAFRAAKGPIPSHPSQDTVSHMPSRFVTKLSPPAYNFLKLQPPLQEIGWRLI